MQLRIPNVGYELHDHLYYNLHLDTILIHNAQEKIRVLNLH